MKDELYEETCDDGPKKKEFIDQPWIFALGFWMSFLGGPLIASLAYFFLRTLKGPCTSGVFEVTSLITVYFVLIVIGVRRKDKSFVIGVTGGIISIFVTVISVYLLAGNPWGLGLGLVS